MAQPTDKQILDSAAAADREQVLAAVARWHESDVSGPCRILLDRIETLDPAHPFRSEAQRFVGKLISAVPLSDSETDTHRVTLQAMSRWNRAARLATEDGLVSAKDVAGLLGDPLAAS